MGPRSRRVNCTEKGNVLHYVRIFPYVFSCCMKGCSVDALWMLFGCSMDAFSKWSNGMPETWRHLVLLFGPCFAHEGPGLTRKPRHRSLLSEVNCRILCFSWFSPGSSELGRPRCQNHAFVHVFGRRSPAGRSSLPRRPCFLKVSLSKCVFSQLFVQKTCQNARFDKPTFPKAWPARQKRPACRVPPSKNMGKRMVLASWASQFRAPK